MDKLVVIIPAYNEQDTIEMVVREWMPVVERIGGGSLLMVIDDGSRDDTFGILTRLQAEFPALCPIRKENGGHGAAVLFGYERALTEGCDYVFQTDSDGQTLAAEFGAFWDMRRDCAMVIGKRSGRQDGLGRVFVSFVLKITLWVCVGVMAPDANTPFRLMEAGALREALALIPAGHPLTNVLLTVTLLKKRRQVIWHPITFRPRQGGKNSINIRRIVSIGIASVGDFLRYRRVLRREGRDE